MSIPFVLPSFITKRSDGLVVTLAKLGKGDTFLAFVDSVFSGGSYFSGLDFGAFNRLLYAQEHLLASVAQVRLAAEVVEFAPDRRTLYRAVQVSPDGKEALYLFEQVYLDSLEDVPISIDGTPSAPVPKSKLAASKPVKLDFDEFVAHLWINGVRAGVDELQIRQIIAKGGTGRLKVAHWIEPTPGKNASIEEKSKLLRRDHSPRALQGGGVDLGMYQNHFPQLEKGELLVKKIPRVIGVPGRKVTGEILLPAEPTDFNLSAMAGVGTVVEERPDGQYVVAKITGFVSIDKASNQFSIAAKIVNRAGVSMRTTGDLQLSGEDYEEFGEIQERRTVEGKNITIHADVFGNIVSRGGVILLERNLMKGNATTSAGGGIIIRGLASAAVLAAPGGKIQVKRAEGCMISGDHIVLEAATQCRIVGRRVEVGAAVGCVVFARAAAIGVAKDHRNSEMTVTMLVPNQAENEKKQGELRERIAEIAGKLEFTRKAIETLKEQNGLGNFLLLKEKLAKGAIQITSEQQTNLFKLENRLSKPLQHLRVLGVSLENLQRTQAELEVALRALEEEAAAVGGDVQCIVSSVTGETVVRALSVDFETDVFSGEGFQTLATMVRGLNDSHGKLFSGSAGKFSWRYKTKANTAKPLTKPA